VADTDFVYTTYINTTPERLWQALTDPAFTRRYWGVALESDWKVGSTVTWKQDGVTIEDPEQVVCWSPSPAAAWPTPGTRSRRSFAKSVGFDDETLARMAAESRSRVTFDIEPRGQMVKLTVIHGGSEPGSVVRESVSQGRPELLSILKTLLETGETLTTMD
jgi:uncharacterized protein YndB with AHSA1/START domain